MSELREDIAKYICCEYPCQHPFGCFRHNHYDQADIVISIITKDCVEKAINAVEDMPCGQSTKAWDYWCGYRNALNNVISRIRYIGKN